MTFPTRRSLLAICVLAAAVMAGREWLPAVASGRQPGSTSTGAPGAAAPEASGQGRTVKVEFKWQPNTEADLAGYIVSWGDKPGVYTSSKSVGPQATSVEFPVVVRPEPYYVVVQARDAKGALSGYSNEFALDVSGGKARAVKSPMKPKPKREKSAKPKKDKRNKPKPPTPP